MEEVAHLEADRYDRALRAAVADGWLIWQLSKPQARLKGYMASTLMNDMPLVLTSGYLDLWHNNLMPPLEALTFWQQASQQSQMTGQPIMDTSKLFWGMLLVLPLWIFEKFQRDFANLARDELRKEAATNELPSLQTPGPLPPPGAGQANPAMAPAGAAAGPV